MHRNLSLTLHLNTSYTLLYIIYFRCSRLGLISLSYLWRRNQAELLDEMIDDGKLNSIIVKVIFSYHSVCIIEQYILIK